MKRRYQRGFATLIVLVSMVWLAFIGNLIGSESRNADQLVENLRRSATMEAAARGAVIHAVYAHAVGQGASFEPDGLARIVTVGGVAVVIVMQRESDRINANTCSAALMEALLAELGVPEARASEIAAAIVAWRGRSRGPRVGGSVMAPYLAAGKSYGPNGEPFSSIDDLRAVLGMDAKLFARMEPHLTVLSDRGPDMSTRDLVVAKALSRLPPVEAAPVAEPRDQTDDIVRIKAVVRSGEQTRYESEYVARADFNGPDPRVRFLLIGH